MSFLAGCMAALGLLILLIVFLVLILDARESDRKAKHHRDYHDAIVRDLRRKEDRGMVDF